MNIQITSRHEKASASLQEAVKTELERVEKFSDAITSCHVVLDNEGNDKSVEIVVNLPGETASTKTTAESVGKALTLAVDKIERQIAKTSDKKKNHKGPGLREE